MCANRLKIFVNLEYLNQLRIKWGKRKYEANENTIIINIISFIFIATAKYAGSVE